jgi:acyl-CoA hydrolase
MHFLAPAKRGDVLLFRASINRSWRSSMEIGVKVLAEGYHPEHVKHILSAYFTFVAVDEKGSPVEVPQVIPFTPIEKRRYEEAGIRRERRKAEADDKIARRQKNPL